MEKIYTQYVKEFVQQLLAHLDPSFNMKEEYIYVYATHTHHLHSVIQQIRKVKDSGGTHIVYVGHVPHKDVLARHENITILDIDYLLAMAAKKADYSLYDKLVSVHQHL